jgi:hypothetical protein
MWTRSVDVQDKLFIFTISVFKKTAVGKDYERSKQSAHSTQYQGTLVKTAHLMKHTEYLQRGYFQASFTASCSVFVSLLIRLHIAGDDDLVCMMLTSSCWSLTTRRTRHLHGAKMSVIGITQIPNSSIIIATCLPNFCEASEVSETPYINLACFFP